MLSLHGLALSIEVNIDSWSAQSPNATSPKRMPKLFCLPAAKKWPHLLFDINHRAPHTTWRTTCSLYLDMPSMDNKVISYALFLCSTVRSIRPLVAPQFLGPSEKGTCYSYIPERVQYPDYSTSPRRSQGRGQCSMSISRIPQLWKRICYPAFHGIKRIVHSSQNRSS